MGITEVHTGIKYVLPNTSEMNRGGRGRLIERITLAQDLGCTHIEVPADFIKNGTEIELTGLQLGDFLNEDAITKLYQFERLERIESNCIFHTEPSLTRRDRNGYTHQEPLRWRDQQWVISLIRMLLQLADHLGIQPWAIEIHPGQRDNTYADVAAAAGAIQAAFAIDNYKPLVVLENRTGQFINSGETIDAFWSSICEQGLGVSVNAGIVLDVQQLFTAHKTRFMQELDKIPVTAVKGLHIHTKHRVPSLEDDIPWRAVAEWMKGLPNLKFLNPEIHHRKHIEDAIQFCEAVLLDA